MAESPILICYDSSDDARHAIAAAAAVLEHRPAVVLDLGPPLTPAESLATISPVVPGAAFEQLNAADALTRANEGADRARRAGFDAQPRAEVAAPTWEGIVDIAEEIDAAVIVMGTRALSGGRELVEGSVSHEVARHAGRPVLIVPPLNDRS